MKIYLAARYSRREELCGYRSELEARGHRVQARWLNGEHQLSNEGTPIGENGEALVEGTEAVGLPAEKVREIEATLLRKVREGVAR